MAILSLDVSLHFYKRPFPSVRWLVGWSVGYSVTLVKSNEKMMIITVRDGMGLKIHGG